MFFYFIYLIINKMSSKLNIPIPVTPQTQTYQIGSIIIRNVLVDPFNSCSVSVDIFTTSNEYIKNRYLSMDKDTYLNWKNDDTFLVNWILQQLSLTPA
jgi:hypothetical protein